MDFPKPIRTKGGKLRPVIRSTEDAIRLIDIELPVELQKQSRWTFARELMVVAGRSGKKRDLRAAFRQVQQALRNDDLLDDQDDPGPDAAPRPEQTSKSVR
jgi:hypothetical protein